MNHAQTPSPLNSARWCQAVKIATEAHSLQYKRGTETPILYHPLAVASWVLKCGGSEDQAIGALLHDAVCDSPELLKTLSTEFGSKVSDVVQAFQDPTEVPAGVTMVGDTEWARSKKMYLHKMSELPSDVLLVIACEELHELSEWVIDYSVNGSAMFSRFQKANRMEWFWYYKECLRIFMKGLTEDSHRALLTEYAARLKRFQSFSLPI